MISTLEWLIPNNVQDNLYSAEWLMIVLSVYFHDMGLIVTEKEFSERSSTGFSIFCENKLFQTASGADYRAKLSELSEDKRERILYGEFVRYNHARRVRSWVEGKPGIDLGYATTQIEEINRLLAGLDKDFRKDLALICESHNLDDLDDVHKYRLSHPYGNSDQETVNLQYCAAILRTVDLIQITKRRAPSVLYRLINPSDPVSQIEWAKQNGVKRIRPKILSDREGNANAGIQSDTIEVFATFHEENAFFGLNAYLRYAAEQISATYRVLQKHKGGTAKPYTFPWKFLDESNIQVEGFVQKPFGFEIDQEKILDLLTGHTLYNDSNVVVRELVQNAIDAVRLNFNSSSEEEVESLGLVTVSWNSSTLELTVADNGTGMTQEIIEKHLLKVGSSRYQDPKFKENYPNFSPISRFGIGVLSAFMVADTVEVTTVSKDEAEARHISLRSVHGKYLIKLADKSTDPLARKIGAHGSIFRLKFRHSAKIIDVADTLKQYVMFPRCRVIAIIDDVEYVIGHRSPKFALEAYLKDVGENKSYITGKTKVVERKVGGFVIAYVLQYSEHYRDWRFVDDSQRHLFYVEDIAKPPVATCIEGIVVENRLPGYGARRPGYGSGQLLAIVNALGVSAPRTNVARSSIEDTNEQLEMVRSTIKVFLNAVSDEAIRLTKEECFSLTWAIEEVPYLLGPVLAGTDASSEVVKSQLDAVPMILVECDGDRAAKSIDELKGIGSFWTVESMLARSIEQFIREARTEVSASKLLEVSQGTSSSLPAGHIVTNSHSSLIVRSSISATFEVTHLAARIEDRRLDLQWRVGSRKWISKSNIKKEIFSIGSSEEYSIIRGLIDRDDRSDDGRGDVLFSIGEVSSENLNGYAGVNINNNLYLIPDTPMHKYLNDIRINNEKNTLILIQLYITLELLRDVNFTTTSYVKSIDRYIKNVEDFVPDCYVPNKGEITEIMDKMRGEFKVYDPLAWGQRERE